MQLMHQFYKVSYGYPVLTPAFSFLLLSIRYRNVIELVELSGIEPLTPCVQGRCSPS